MAKEDFILAANSGVPTNRLKPNNCHEAVLGWLLYAKFPSLQTTDFPLADGAAKAWFSLRSLVEKYGEKGKAQQLKQLTGPWIAEKIYNRGNYVRVQPPFSEDSFDAGAVLFMGVLDKPHHSMVVVNWDGTHALARGFNNAGMFGGPSSMVWDSELRDIADLNRWNAAAGQFIGVNGACNVHIIKYDEISGHIPDNLTF